MPIPQRTDAYGGQGGMSFDGSSHDIDISDRGKICQIIIRHGNTIDSIRAVYVNGDNFKYGGNGGGKTIINLDLDESISRVTGRSGNMLDQIKFFTSKGKEYGPFGGNGGKPFEANFNGKSLLYFFGRAGTRIDQIGFGYGDSPPPLPSNITRSITHGGKGGGAFDDFMENKGLPGKISSIQVRHGSRVDAIRIRYDNSSGYHHHGGSGGKLSEEFSIRDDEWITEIRGRSGNRVDQIQFILSSRRFSPIYGGNGGAPFSLKMDKNVVRSLYGRAGNGLDQIGAYFEDAKIREFEIIKLHYEVDQIKLTELEPRSMTTIMLENDTDIVQQTTRTRSVKTSKTLTTSVSQTWGASIKFTIQKDVLIKKKGVEIGFTANRQYKTDSSDTVSEEDGFKFSANVPPKSIIKAVCIEKRGSFEVPWTATAEVLYQGSSKPVTRTLNGKFQGVQTLSLEAKYESIKPTTPQQSTSDRLNSGEKLSKGSCLISQNRQYKFCFQEDSNVVLYKGSKALWDNGMWNTNAREFIMQADGNLVEYGDKIWASDTYSGETGSGEYLVVENDGNVVIYKGDGSVSKELKNFKGRFVG